LTDLSGRPVAREELAGRPVLVEFWATWCPPCRGTLGWLGELKRRHGDRLAVLAVAIESDEADVRRVAGQAGAPLRWVLGSPEVARAFGDVSAMPTLLLFDRAGRQEGSFLGAPPGLHAEVEAALEPLLGHDRR
jgi:thiol-disulfide isomerase/thioredoxin